MMMAALWAGPFAASVAGRKDHARASTHQEPSDPGSELVLPCRIHVSLVSRKQRRNGVQTMHCLGPFTRLRTLGETSEGFVGFLYSPRSLSFGI